MIMSVSLLSLREDVGRNVGEARVENETNSWFRV